MSLTENLDAATELIEHRFQGHHGPGGLAYLRSDAFLNQLGPADTCLNCFLAYELDPNADEPVGGEGRAALAALVSPPADLREPVRRAVATTVTSSYLTMMSIEDPPGSNWVPGRDAEPLWRFWVGHLRPTATLALGIPSEFVGSVGTEGGAQLEAEIARLGLKPGFRRRRTFSNRCFEVSKFGLLLRLGQTNGCSDVEFEQAQESEGAERWPFRALTVQDRAT